MTKEISIDDFRSTPVSLVPSIFDFFLVSRIFPAANLCSQSRLHAAQCDPHILGLGRATLKRINNSTMAFSKAAVLALAAIGSVKAQFAEPVPKWTATFLPMLDNNGLVWAPDDSSVYATSSDGTVGLFNPDDGTSLGTFQPPGDGTVPFTCNGEVSFNSVGDTIIYAVSEGDSW
jgi:hypothetical protein